MAKVSEAFTGARFGMLTVVALGPPTSHRRVLCRCDCGKDKDMALRDFAREIKSCGCGPGAPGRHGHAGSERLPTYVSWHSMNRRCVRPQSAKWYASRGVAVCSRWSGADGYVNFLADMGERPPGSTLDRIDPSKGYEPGNCRWATNAEQARNKRASKVTAEMVRDIVAGKYSAIPSNELSPVVGLLPNHITSIRRGDSWTDVVAACRREQDPTLTGSDSEVVREANRRRPRLPRRKAAAELLLAGLRALGCK